MMDESSIDIDYSNSTDISVGTTAKTAYDLYCAKKKQIYDLRYECDLLVDKYHKEMCKSHIPFEFSEQNLNTMFIKDASVDASVVDFARKLFLEKGFSGDFIGKHDIEFVSYTLHGYQHTAIGIVLGIGNYRYTITIPLPKNILNSEDKESLVGQVKFSVNRIHKSKCNDFYLYMESVQVPTYDWKACFAAIEADVAKEAEVQMANDNKDEKR